MVGAEAETGVAVAETGVAEAEAATEAGLYYLAALTFYLVIL